MPEARSAGVNSLPPRADVTIALCTANRPEMLRETLEALRAVYLHEDLKIEWLIVDNAPDSPQGAATAAVVRAFAEAAAFPIRYVVETRAGLSRARNRALAQAHGEIILFTDDDVRPPQDWIERMIEPIRTGAADTVAGGVRLAPNLVRPWMEKIHYGMLASTEWARPGEELLSMVGANMAFHRRVLEKVPSFDVELGAGTPIGGEEVLFSFQTLKAGFRMVSRTEVAVEHHFEPSRLTRSAFEKRLAHTGREVAYFRYHWEHEPVQQVRRNIVRSAIDLIRARRISRRTWPHSEGVPYAELKLIELHHFYRQYRIERRRPRNYDRFGILKRNGELADVRPGPCGPE